MRVPLSLHISVRVNILCSFRHIHLRTPYLDGQSDPSASHNTICNAVNRNHVKYKQRECFLTKRIRSKLKLRFVRIIRLLSWGSTIPNSLVVISSTFRETSPNQRMTHPYVRILQQQQLFHFYQIFSRTLNHRRVYESLFRLALGTARRGMYSGLPRVVPPIFFLFPPKSAELKSKCCSPFVLTTSRVIVNNAGCSPLGDSLTKSLVPPGGTTRGSPL